MLRLDRVLIVALAALLIGALASGVASARGPSGGIGIDDGSASGAGGGSGSGSGGEGSKGPGGDGRFPILGPHTYGDGLGAGRGHQGQDLLAKCGKPVIAARAGRVRYRDYQGSGAGNYVVVKGRGYDYVYMHLLRPAKVRKGQRIRAGQRIGQVGSTGRSSACHLHFEMWTKPGWYRGGGIVNPTPSLKRWDHGR